MSSSSNTPAPVSAPVSPSTARRHARQPRIDDPVNYYMSTITHMTRAYTPETRIDALSDCMRVLPHVDVIDEVKSDMARFNSFMYGVEFDIRKHDREVDAKFKALEDEMRGIKAELEVVKDKLRKYETPEEPHAGPAYHTRSKKM